jgi:ribosomal protein S18 acetylase RimI-like enzyme
MKVPIRLATADDAPFLAWVMLQAARGHLGRGIWDITLDRPERQCLAYLELLAVTPTRSWFHYSGFKVVDIDGHSVSALCGYDPHAAGTPAVVKATDEVADQLLWSKNERLAGWKRFEPIRPCISDEAEGAWIIENVATLPEFRGRGIVDALLGAMLDEGRTRGYRLAQISILIGNTRAQRAYERAGFKVIDEKRHADFEAVVGAPGMRRLLRDL